MWVVLLAAAAMALQDMCGTLLTIAEARGRRTMAGLMDAAGDIARVLCTAFGAGEIIVHGWTPRSFEVLGAMCITSFVVTRYATGLGARFCEEPGKDEGLIG